MKLLRLLPLPALLVLGAPVAQTQTATTDPVGFVTVNVTAGTGVAKRNTLISLPLLENESIDGQAAGRITGITANSISNADAGWTPGALSAPASPYLIQITSGDAAGRMFLVASSAATGGASAGTPNTATTVTISPIDAAQVDLTTLGIHTGEDGDTYRIYPCDTLSSFFGTPEDSGVLGGANANSADSVIISVNGNASTYYYNTTNSRWARNAFGNPDSSNVALVPYYGMQYQRLPNTPLSFVITGAVPVTDRQVSVKNSGVTFLSQYWPADSTLGTLGLQSLDGWLSGPNVASADVVTLTIGTAVNTYWYDGTNWRRNAFGNPISDNVQIPVGATVSIQKKGADAGYATLAQEVPYEL